MLNTYFKFLSRNKIYTAIELFGLSVALGFVVLLASYAKTEYSVGTRQPLSSQLYAIGTSNFIGMTLGTSEEFFPSVPEISGWTRAADYGQQDILVGNEHYYASIAALDTNFLKFFDYRINGCSRDKILDKEGEVLLSESFARSLFGNEDPIGRVIRFSNGDLTVTGTLEDFGPYDLFTKTDMFVGMQEMAKTCQRMDNFGTVQTFLTLQDGVDPDAVATKLLEKYENYWDFYKNSLFLSGSSLTRFDKLYFSDIEKYGFIRSGDKKQVSILLIVALVLLVSALFNYINLTVALTGKRSKEMATRRLLGESSAQVVLRYIGESFFFTLLCFIAGAVLAVLMQPFFERTLSADIALALEPTTLAVALLLLVVISVIAALLPATIVSRFKPVDVVKGEFRFRSKLVFGKVFIVLQNVFSIVLIAVAASMLSQIHHLVTLPTGYNTDNIITIRSHSLGYSASVQKILHDELESLPMVNAVGMGIQTPNSCGANGLHGADNKVVGWIRLCTMDTTAFRIFGFKIQDKFTDALGDLVFYTETAAKRLGVTREHPYPDTGNARREYESCGIIADFRAGTALFTPEENEYTAVGIMPDDSEYIFSQVLSVSGDRKETIDAVRAVCDRVSMELTGMPKTMEIKYIDESLTEDLAGTRNTMLLVIMFMIVSILVSVLGLVAMSLYYTEQQSKRVALTKVFGSEVWSAVWRLSRSFMILSIIASVIAIPVAIELIERYLKGFYYRIPMPWWILVAAVLLSLLLSVASIFVQAWRTATRNPAETLNQDNA